MNIKDFTKPELLIISHRANAVWQEIAEDVLSLPDLEHLEGIDYTKTVSRDEVIEWVNDVRQSLEAAFEAIAEGKAQ